MAQKKQTSGNKNSEVKSSSKTSKKQQNRSKKVNNEPIRNYDDRQGTQSSIFMQSRIYSRDKLYSEETQRPKRSEIDKSRRKLIKKAYLKETSKDNQKKNKRRYSVVNSNRQDGDTKTQLSNRKINSSDQRRTAVQEFSQERNNACSRTPSRQKREPRGAEVMPSLKSKEGVNSSMKSQFDNRLFTVSLKNEQEKQRQKQSLLRKEEGENADHNEEIKVEVQNEENNDSLCEISNDTWIENNNN